jgi:hypothetical protein
MDGDVRALTDALTAPFEPREVKFKPQMVKNNKALAIAYVDVRVIEDRLDDVVGVENWQDNYEILPDGSVTCRLTIQLGGTWITKMDVGSPSEQPDGGDRLKAAFSDALKRTAIKFGIGRYLYRLPGQWVDYDPAKKQIVRPPQLPAWAVPMKRDQPPAKGVAAPAEQPPDAGGADDASPVEAYLDGLDAATSRAAVVAIKDEAAADPAIQGCSEGEKRRLRKGIQLAFDRHPKPAAG